MKSIGVVGKAFKHVGTKMESAAIEYKTKSTATRTKLSTHPATHQEYTDIPNAAPTLQEQPGPAPFLDESLTRSLTGSTERAQKYGAC